MRAFSQPRNRFQRFPAAFFYGIKPAVLVIILAAVLKLGKKALKTWELGILGVLVLAASLFGVNEVVALLAGGVAGAIYFFFKYRLTDNKLNSIIHFLFYL